MKPVWGIDLGGTKVEGVILDPAEPQKALCRLRVPTEAEKGADHIYGQIRRVCEMLREQSGLSWPERIGMGTPGVVDPRSHTLKNSNSQCLNGQNIREAVEKLIGVDFVVANDANCFALAEANYGAARGFPTVFGIIIGTGVGGGIVANGQMLSGCHGIAGEWGQLILEAGGQLSKYGTRGTVEALLSGPGLEAFYESRTGRHRRLCDIAASTATDADARATIDRLTDYFARAITFIIDILDPHAIVLGGGVGNIDALYTEDMREKIRSRIFNPTFDAALLRPLLGDSAGVIGAAMLVAD